MTPRATWTLRLMFSLTVISVGTGVAGLALGADMLVAAALLALVTLAVVGVLWINKTARKLLRSLDKLVQERTGEIQEAIGQGKTALQESLADNRKKQSRHEYLQEASLKRIEVTTSTLRGDVEGILWRSQPEPGPSLTFQGLAPGTPRVLLVSSNGGGVGHLTRLLAVAKNAQPMFDVSVLTLSTAHHVTTNFGYPSFYYPSKDASGLSYHAWHREFSRFFDGLMHTNAIDAVIFDGTWLYRGIHESCARQRVPLVWSCRGLWRATTDQQQLRSWKDLATDLVVPGEALLDHDDSLEAQNFRSIPPVTMFSRSELHSREDALETLGLAPDRNHVLIQVGGGNMRDTSNVRELALRAVGALGRDWMAVIATSPLSTEQFLRTPRVMTVRKYPLAQNLRAFDFAVTAAGYNTVHENILACLPTVLVPSDETLTDDQPRRANLMASRGLGYEASNDRALSEAIERLGSAETRLQLRSALGELDWRNGGRALAELTASLLRQ